jgi:hypothetical protein
MKWIHEAAITMPAGDRFPLDMLRYDTCWPADSATVEAILHPPAHVFCYRITRTTGSKLPAFTPTRWASFGARLHTEPAFKIG